MTPAEIVPIALAIARLGIDAADGEIDSVGDVARSLVGLGLQLVPRDELQRYLTEFGIVRGELAADIAEEAKFGVIDEDGDGT
jgi:hypothetical protein